MSLEEAKIDLAAALRLAAYFGFNEGVCNHFSVAVPGEDDRFLLNPHGIHWSMIRASDILTVNAAGDLIEGPGPAELTAFTIHSRVHASNPAARAVLHTHMPYATALTCVEGAELAPVHQNSLRFYGDVAYDRGYNGLAEDAAEGDRIAACLGHKRVLFMGNHGVLVVGESIARAFDDLYYLEQACRVQVLAMSTGCPLNPVGDDVARKTYGEYQQGGAYPEAHFDALKRLLDRKDGSYRE